MAREDGEIFVISTLEEAKMRINELEKENEELKAEVERLKARNLGGRKKHNRHGSRLIRNLQLSTKQE